MMNLRLKGILTTVNSMLKSIGNPVDFKFKNIGENINTHNG